MKGGFEEFRQAMAKRESDTNYACVNNFGFLGAYQFGKPRLYDLGISLDGWTPKGKPALKVISKKDFLSNKDLQDHLFKKHIALHKNSALSYAKFVNNEYTYKDKKFKLTLSGMVAVMHLLGTGGLQKFLKGEKTGDALGTSAEEYAYLFSDYDI